MTLRPTSAAQSANGIRSVNWPTPTLASVRSEAAKTVVVNDERSVTVRRQLAVEAGFPLHDFTRVFEQHVLVLHGLIVEPGRGLPPRKCGRRHAQRSGRVPFAQGRGFPDHRRHQPGR